MVTVPGEIPDITPVDVTTVATTGLSLDQIPPATVDPKVVVPFTQID
jgi:hypothetical protein